MVDTFACSFLATELEARSGIQTVVEQLRNLGIPDTRADEVQIALAEAINNIVEHAYAQGTPGNVDIRCRLEPDHLWIDISDNGQPFPENKLPAGKPANLNVPSQDLPEGGFGWFLIRALTSKIKYQRNNGYNELTLCFEIRLTEA